jgi:hypothetical protein
MSDEPTQPRGEWLSATLLWVAVFIAVVMMAGFWAFSRYQSVLDESLR